MSKRIKIKEYYTIIIRLSRFMEKNRTRYFLGKILASLEIMNVIIFPFIFKNLIAIVSGSVSNLNKTILSMTGLLISVLILTPIICFGAYISQKACIHGKVNLKKEAISHMQNMNISKLGNKRIGDYITILSSDVENCMGIFSSYGIKSVFQFIVILPVTLVILFYYSWQIALIAILFSFMCIQISAVFNPKVNVLAQDAKREMGNTANALIELISGYAVVRMFACYDRLCLNL